MNPSGTPSRVVRGSGASRTRARSAPRRRRPRRRARRSRAWRGQRDERERHGDAEHRERHGCDRRSSLPAVGASCSIIGISTRLRIERPPARKYVEGPPPEGRAFRLLIRRAALAKGCSGGVKRAGDVPFTPRCGCNTRVKVRWAAKWPQAHELPLFCAARLVKTTYPGEALLGRRNSSMIASVRGYVGDVGSWACSRSWRSSPS